MFESFAMRDNSLPIMPALPVLGKNISLFKSNNSTSILNYSHISFLTSGGSAIYSALNAHGVGSSDEVLIPSYHCPAMVEPVISLGAKPVFYSITRDINIDINSIKTKINHNTAAILVPHFFGVRSDIQALREECRLPESICIIEDCAHSFFSYSKNPVEHGDYIVGSLTKFFPTHDGGVLASNAKALLPSESLSLKQELKAIYNAVHDAVRFGRYKLLAWLFSIVAFLRNRETQDLQDNDQVDYKKSDGSVSGYDDEYHKQMNLSASKACKFIVKHADFAQVINKRKENYQYILNELANQKYIDLSLNKLGDDFIPYMVVVKLLNPDKHHAKLISNRLPVWRWEHIYPSSCEIAKEYSRSIIQVPCHQQLTKAELISMVKGIKECLKE